MYNGPVSESALELELLELARDAARAAAVELLPRFGHRQDGVRAKSTPTDLVSEADLAAESSIRAVLGDRRPQDAILGEEGGADAGRRAALADRPARRDDQLPVRRSPVCGQRGVRGRDGGLVGVVLDPVRDECFSATRSGPARLNGSPIAPSRRDELATALVATGFDYDARVRARQAAVLSRVLPNVRDIRRAGSAALDLSWCACGRYDAYFERGVKQWDYGAGGLIASRAGLEVRKLAAAGDDPAGMLVAPAAFVDELLALVLGRS